MTGSDGDEGPKAFYIEIDALPGKSIAGRQAQVDGGGRDIFRDLDRMPRRARQCSITPVMET